MVLWWEMGFFFEREDLRVSYWALLDISGELNLFFGLVWFLINRCALRREAWSYCIFLIVPDRSSIAFNCFGVKVFLFTFSKGKKKENGFSIARRALRDYLIFRSYTLRNILSLN